MKKILEKILESIVSNLIWFILASIIGGSTLSWLFFRESIWLPTIKFLQSPIKKYPIGINWLTLILLYSLIPLCIYWGYKIHTYIFVIKHRRFFHESGFLWCFNRSNWKFEEIPYCKKHYVQLSEIKNGYFCFECKKKGKEKLLTKERRNLIYRLIRPTIMAKVNGHYKRF